MYFHSQIYFLLLTMWLIKKLIFSCNDFIVGLLLHIRINYSLLPHKIAKLINNSADIPLVKLIEI